MSDSKKEVSNLTAVTVLLFFGVIIFWLGSFVGFTMGQRNAELVYERRVEAVEQRAEGLEVELQDRQWLKEEFRALRQEHQMLLQMFQEWVDGWGEVEEWINGWEIEEWDATFYAPLDPNAIEGMCYAGNPTVTASGATVEIGRTIAAGPDIPIGTVLYIEGFGWREVQDRGGAIGPGQVDIAVATRQEALEYGRQIVKVLFRGDKM